MLAVMLIIAGIVGFLAGWYVAVEWYEVQQQDEIERLTAKRDFK